MMRRVFALIVMSVVLNACGNKPPVEMMQPAEICNNRHDDNGDGKTDCADPTCFEDAACATVSENCANGKDDNANGKIDCADPLCSGASCGDGCVCIGGQKYFDDGGVLGGGSATGGGTASDAGEGGGFVSGGGTASTGGGAETGGGTATMGGGTVTGGGSSTGGGSTGGGTASGGGSVTTGGGSATGGGSDGGGSATGGGSVTTGGGTATGGGAVNGGGTATGGGIAVGGGSATTGGGVSTGGGAVTGGGSTTGGGSGTGGGTAVCTANDCADPRCVADPTCTSLNDGAACSSATQCLGGACKTEAASGFPRGQCRNVASCTVAGNIGCHGGRCVAGTTFNSCLPACTGTGTGSTGKCRTGYACWDPDTNTMNNNSYCMALCTADSECAGSGPGYGCNPWSKLCGVKDQAKTKYGGPCTSNANCESNYCITGSLSPGGYCGGYCRGDTHNCGPSGFCAFDPSYGDNVGLCLQSCTVSTQCRTSENYRCFETSSGSGIGTCQCLGVNSACDYDGQCCSGSCTGFFTLTCD